MGETQKTQYIADLIAWIEDNLTEELNIDTIAQKSGYSKWHMQRLFKEMTGQTVATYARKRRLTKSAMALRLTRLSLIDIAIRYGFDTQQNFTRAFRHHFALTPHAYRYADELNTAAFHSRFNPLQQETRLPELVTLPDRVIYGESHRYECLYGDFVEDKQQILQHYLSDFIRDNKGSREQGYITLQFTPCAQRKEYHTVSLMRGLEQREGEYSLQAQRDILPGGLWLKLALQIDPCNFSGFIIDAYYHHLAQPGLARRPGQDFLTLDLPHCSSEQLTGYLFIPVNFHLPNTAPLAS
ncbi:AraC family transcriptional activator of mar-sox-rob regulon [Pantoea alhagi]|uniref:helix-turn-helix domain-containing protein n=1 Tax=Mixta sp. BE291 TaxID=3158787 RepID=UPI00285AA6B8|nr:AraC family transcriptional activator of mar-sox-rob regulon [Pantoea alhagi]